MIVKITNNGSDDLNLDGPFAGTIRAGETKSFPLSLNLSFLASNRTRLSPASSAEMDNLVRNGILTVDIIPSSGDVDIDDRILMFGSRSTIERAFVADPRVGFGDFNTIQEAINAAEALIPEPTWDSPAFVFVMPKEGFWDENIVVRKDGIRIIGLGGQGCTKLVATIGHALTLTNATPDSLAAYDVSGNYADLVSQGAVHPWDIQLRNIEIESRQAGKHALRLLGVKGDHGGGTLTSFLGNELLMIDVTLRATGGGGARSIFARNANYISTGGYFWGAAAIELHNIAGFWPLAAQLAAVTVEYNAASPYGQPTDTGNYGFCGAKCIVRGNLTLQGTGRASGDLCAGNTIEGDLDIQDGNVGRGTMIGCHVQGAVKLANGATFRMDGGRYMGALVDPGGGLTRNIGS